MSWTEALWLAPAGSTQPMVTELPGWWVANVEVRSEADEMVEPSTDTMTSPAPIPAFSAALPDWTRLT